MTSDERVYFLGEIFKASEWEIGSNEDGSND
jgi:hypothetical protein